MGVKNAVAKIGNRVGNRVAKLAELSSEQVERVQLQREAYLLEEPKPYDTAAQELTERMMAASSIEIFNAYLPQIKELYLPIEKNAEYGVPFDPAHNIRYFNITKWVTDKKENNLEKLVNVYAVLSNEPCNIALVFNRTKNETNVYLAVVNTQNDDNNVNADIYKARLLDAIRGNFPGAEWKEEGMGILPCMDNDKVYSVATASNIPTEKSEKFISQTIEKLLDGIVPDSRKKEYTIVLLATPIQDVEERKMKLGEFYSGLAPYASWQTDYHIMDNQMVGSSATVGVNVGASAGIQNSNNYSTTDSDSTTDSTSTTDTQSQSDTVTEGTSHAENESTSHAEGTSETDTTTKGTNGSRAVNDTQTIGETNTTTSTRGTSSSDTLGASVNVFGSQSVGVNGGVGILGANANTTVGASVGINSSHTTGTSSSIANAIAKSKSFSRGVTNTSGWMESTAKALGKNITDTATKGFTDTVSNSVSKMTGSSVANTLGKAVTKGLATTSGITKGTNLGLNFGANFARSSTVTAMIGKNEGITQSFTNYNIKHALELLESQMKRLEQSTALGMWDFAAYVISEDQNVANNVAHSYLALTLGEESYMSKSAINLWRGSVEEEKDIARTISTYIKELRHPVFALNPMIVETDSEFNEYPSIVTATTSLSGKELAYSLNFPQKSVAGLPIIECAEFARNVVTYDLVNDVEKKIALGKIFHMNHRESSSVKLALNSLASHTFITGSTGAGKSNTIYQILDSARDQGVHFLVIEPAKGEYKNIFGHEDDTHVYGTNPNLTPLLRINPFSFPDGIHILEHLDRLVEIFNVCWPMYAAMPAVLKNAVEKSYQDCGWNLLESTNKYGRNLYPVFADVARNVKSIMDSSEYDDENKGAYKGALLTRLQSLTNGINGMIFTTDEIPSDDLFEENVIVDLSRVGSSETKSLIMGMLVLKLQEHRMTTCTGMNVGLNHITVLEEAHNILRRTSIEQSSESANILGKSVEMLANSIAEMRTYGEGFIIADQAPGLMDMSVIRNTNTKIIMRLPDQMDRELVGKAANLNEDQIMELAKLPCGVCAVYQNEWIQPVLCKVDRFHSIFSLFKYDGKKDVGLNNDNQKMSEQLLKAIMNMVMAPKGDKRDLRELKDDVLCSNVNTVVKVDFMEFINAAEGESVEKFRRLVYDFFEADTPIQEAGKYDDIHDWVDAVIKKMKPSIKSFSKEQIDYVMGHILREKADRDVAYNELYIRYTEVCRNGGVVK